MSRGNATTVRWISSSAGVLTFLVSVIGFPAEAAWRLVPEPYPTIRAAIQDSKDGDEIVIAPGLYRGEGNRDLDFEGRRITIRSVTPSDPTVVASTVIDCQGTAADPHRAFKFISGERDDSRLLGLTITGGFAPIASIDPWLRRSGGAILLLGSSPTIDGCVFTDNRADYGGAVGCWESSDPALIDSTFIANTAAVDGAAILVRDSGPTIVDCTFQDNSGTVISCSGSGAATITGCTIADNTGTAIFCAQRGAVISKSILANNDILVDLNPSAVLVTSGSDVAIDNCLINGNRGIGAMSFEGHPTFNHSTIVANETPVSFASPIWIDAPDRAAAVRGTFQGYWNGRLWSFNSRRTVAFDGVTYQTGGLVRPENTPRRTYFMETGIFVFSHRDDQGFLEKSPDGIQDFEVKLSGTASMFSLPRSLVWCGPTNEHAEDVMFYFEYAASPRVFTSTDGGESWSALFQCAEGAIRHFHGAVFAPSVGGNEGRLYIMTGDSNRQSSVLFCDDIDDLIANPEVWRTRWGLDVVDRHDIDPDYTINDNLDKTNSPTSQVFRVVDMLMAGDGYGYWSLDSQLENGQSVHRVNHTTKVVERVGTGTAMGSGWLWLETASGMKLFLTAAEVPGGTNHPSPGHDEFIHLYRVTADGRDFVEVRRWIRSDAARPTGPTIGQSFAEAFGHLWISVTSRAVEYGDRNLVGRIDSDPPPPGAGVHVFDSDLIIENSILWGNRRVDDAGSGVPQLAGTAADLRYCCVEGLAPELSLPGNVSEDPRFVMPEGFDGLSGTEDDDLTLLPDSPCIDTGDPAFSNSPNLGDLDSSYRTRCVRTDMGAFEFGFGDYNCDRAVNLTDFGSWSTCMSDPPGVGYPAGCSPFDVNMDFRVDMMDFAVFMTALSQ